MRVGREQASRLRDTAAAELAVVAQHCTQLAAAEVVPCATQRERRPRAGEEREVGRDRAAAEVRAVAEQRVAAVARVPIWRARPVLGLGLGLGSDQAGVMPVWRGRPVLGLGLGLGSDQAGVVPVWRGRPVWPASQNCCAHWPWLAEDGDHPELDLALAGRAEGWIGLAEASGRLFCTWPVCGSSARSSARTPLSSPG